MYHRFLACAALLTLGASAMPQAADGFMTRESPDPLRAKLVPPTLWWEAVKHSVGRSGQPMGYTGDEMLGYPNNEHKLQTVDNLFRDILAPAEYSGLLSDNMILMADRPAELAYVLWSQLGARAGREWAVPKDKDDWGVDWIPKGTKPADAMRLAAEYTHPSSPYQRTVSPTDLARFSTLPEPLQRLAARLVVGAQLSRPFLNAACSGVPPIGGLVSGGVDLRRVAYELFQSPYYGDVNDDTIIVSDRRAYDAMREFDLNYSSFAAVSFLRQFDAALAELRKSNDPSIASARFDELRLNSSLGLVRISDSANSKFADNAVLHIDCGGDDAYLGLQGVPMGPSIRTRGDLERRESVIVDLGGNDTYDSRGLDGSIASGFLGLGMIYDESGNDHYNVRNGGLGFALYGTGILIDNAGDDKYRCKNAWAMGAAYAGVGLLLDRAGNDNYYAVNMSMGFGGTKGIGALVDLQGNDAYRTSDTGNHSKVWGKTVSMAMGCGYGRRCDSGDGQSQGGGIGLLLDADGDDSYYSGVFAIGSGYWWGAGLFEDRNGNDTYRATNYSFGSGAHFAVGSFVDVHGNDRYNIGEGGGETFACVGRDGSMASCIDGDGNDIYNHMTFGWTNLNSYALFWDRRGDDDYRYGGKLDPNSPPASTFGSSALFPLQRNFRDRKVSVGIFLDTQGRDTYPRGFSAAENSSWTLQKGPLFWGYGRDGEAAGL